MERLIEIENWKFKKLPSDQLLSPQSRLSRRAIVEFKKSFYKISMAQSNQRTGKRKIRNPLESPSRVRLRLLGFLVLSACALPTR